MPETSSYKKPLPWPDHPDVSREFWDGLQRHELLMPHCKACDTLHFYPREACPNCFSQNLDWVKVSGKGSLYAYTIVHQPAHPAFNDDVPYVHAVIQLLEGTRMVSNVIGIDPHKVEIGMPLEAVYEDVTPEWTLVKFKPAEG